jgi:biotin transport system substrate-specific component
MGLMMGMQAFEVQLSANSNLTTERIQLMQKEFTFTQRTVFVPSYSRSVNLALILGASLFIALLSQVVVRLPFSPVPITGQTFAVLLVGAALGSRRGALAVLTYLAEGVLGLPVFAGGGSGLAYLMGPTGGFLLGFIAMAWVVGWLAERGRDRRIKTSWLIFLAGELVLFVIGIPWLALYVGADKALALGLIPFIPGEIIKIILAGLAFPAAWQLTNVE